MSIPPFTFTGSSQTLTVPTSGVYDITAYGAQGGFDPSGGTGGPVVDAVWKRLLDRAGPRRLPPMNDES